MVTNECTTIICLPLHIKAGKCGVQSFDEYTILTSESLPDLLVQVTDLLVLKTFILIKFEYCNYLCMSSYDGVPFISQVVGCLQ